MASNTFSYTNATGPTFLDGTVGFSATFNLQSLTANRILVIPDAAGTIALTGTPTFTGDVTASTGNVLIGTAGKGLSVKGGSNAKIGTATLVSGTVTVADTAVTANSIILLFAGALNASTAIGSLSVPTITAATSFVITSYIPGGVTTQTGDLRTVGYLIVEKA
jgi:hypothetical protein